MLLMIEHKMIDMNKTKQTNKKTQEKQNQNQNQNQKTCSLFKKNLEEIFLTQLIGIKTKTVLFFIFSTLKKKKKDSKEKRMGVLRTNINCIVLQDVSENSQGYNSKTLC